MIGRQRNKENNVDILTMDHDHDGFGKVSLWRTESASLRQTSKPSLVSSLWLSW
jgi:hypothetical protein